MEVRKVLEDRMASWRALRQQRHTSLLQAPLFPFAAAGSSTRTQHTPSVFQESTKAFLHAQPVGTAVAHAPQWRGGGAAGVAAENLAVAHAMWTVHIGDFAPQGLSAGVGEQRHAVDGGNLCGVHTELQPEHRFAFTRPQPTSMKRCTGVRFRFRSKPRLAYCNALRLQNFLSA